jgi:O-antigen ligase
LVLLVSIKFLAPGAINNVLTQLAPSQLGVSTVDDRVLRFDAIRPDVWLHPLFGQGFGVYSIRILDNELLQRLLEGGLLGLAAYVLMLLIIVFVATALVRSRERDCATVALVAAAAAVSVLVMSALYDWMAYPHDPYILLSLAGLLAVAVKSRREEPFAVEHRSARQPSGVRSSPASGRHGASDEALSAEYAWSS